MRDLRDPNRIILTKKSYSEIARLFEAYTDLKVSNWLVMYVPIVNTGDGVDFAKVVFKRDSFHEWIMDTVEKAPHPLKFKWTESLE